MIIHVARFIEGRWQLVQHNTPYISREAIAVGFAGTLQIFSRQSGKLLEQDTPMAKTNNPVIPSLELQRIDRHIDLAVDRVAHRWHRHPVPPPAREFRQQAPWTGPLRFPSAH